jgi:hypothetical protein
MSAPRVQVQPLNPDYSTLEATPLYAALPEPLPLAPIYTHVHVSRYEVVRAPGTTRVSEAQAVALKQALMQYAARAGQITKLNLIYCSVSACPTKKGSTIMRVTLSDPKMVGLSKQLHPDRVRASVSFFWKPNYEMRDIFHDDARESGPRLTMSTEWIAANPAQLRMGLFKLLGCEMLASKQAASSMSISDIKHMASALNQDDAVTPKLYPHNGVE